MKKNKEEKIRIGFWTGAYFWKAELYTNLTKLIVKIADHIFEKEEDNRKGIGDVMGGKVLELESERLKAEGNENGMNEGDESRSNNLKHYQEALLKRVIHDER